MIYERHFSTEWDSLTRDEAMVRAFVLGIDAARGDERQEELDRLRDEDARAFVEMAYNAGEREYLDLEEEEETRSERDDPVDELPTASTSEIVSELVVSRRERPDDGPSGPDRATVDVPAMLDEYEFLDTRPDEPERLGLPDFL